MRKIVLWLILALVSVGMISCQKNPEKEAEVTSEKRENVITLYSLKDDTLCPILTDNEANRQMLSIVYESLVVLKSNMEPEGVLAKDWKVSSDGLEWTFNLRPNVKWHNGESFSANDVVYTINRIKEAESGSYKYNVSKIESVQESGNSVVIKLTEACPNFANLMTFPIIKSGDVIERTSFSPCGTGAYIFSDKNEGNLYYLLKNDKWWGGEVKIDKIRIKLLPDSETVSYSFSSGDIDIANTKWGKKNSTGGTAARTTSCSLPVYDFIGINHNNAVLKNKEVRNAMSMAVKREKIVNDIFSGNAIMANAPIRDDWFDSANENGYEPDNTEAENLLMKSGWKKEDGVYRSEKENEVQKLEFEIIVNEENSSRINIAESIRSDLVPIGIMIKVVPLPFDEYERRITSGEYQLFVGSTMIPDDVDLSYLLGSGNMFSYENENISRIMNEIKAAQNRNSMISGYEQLKNRFNAEVPLIGICFENFEMLYSKKVGGELSSSRGNIYHGLWNLYIEE